ncbi:MAG: T9SS type A sorting domain-containing protein [Spirochaetia bacterium]|nr:T9SS type A sorting domain-containing protein [Spirochaetia bacterium]
MKRNLKKNFFFVSLVYFLSIYSLYSADSSLPAEPNNWLHVTGGGGGDVDGLSVIFFEVPETETSTIYFGINDPGCDNDGPGPDDCTSNADTYFYLYGGSGALSDPDSRLRNYSGQQSKAKTGGSLLSSFTQGNTTGEGWVYFSGVSASQGEKIGNKYYFKIVVEATSSLGNNAYQVDISYQNSGNPVGVADVKTFSYSWTIDLRDDGNLWNLYPFVPDGAGGNVIVHNYDMETKEFGEFYNKSSVLVNDILGASSITKSANGEATNSYTIGAETNGTWNLKLTGLNDGSGENTAEFWFTNSVTSELYRIYSSPYTPSAPHHVSLSYDDGMIINDGLNTETITVQIVDEFLNPLPYSKSVYVTVSGSAIITESNNNANVNANSTVVTTDSSGIGFIKVKDMAIETVTISAFTDGNNGSQYFGVIEPDTITVESVSNIPPQFSSAGNKTFIKSAGVTLGPNITIINSPISTLITTGNDIRIQIPAQLSAEFDTTNTVLTYTGTANTKASTTVTYPDSKTLLIDVTANFLINDTFTISGLKYQNFLVESSGKPALCYDGTGVNYNVTDDKVYSVLDTSPPVITLRETADLNGDGFIDALHLTFSKNIKDISVTPANFSINGGAVTGQAFSSTTNSDTANDNDIYITFTDGILNTGAVPTVQYAAGTLTDLAGNAMVSEASAVVSVDKAAPVLTVVSIFSNHTNAAYAKTGHIVSLNITASETLLTVPTVTIFGLSVMETGTGPYSATHATTGGEAEGIVPFTIDFTDSVGIAGTQVSATTDLSSVTFDKTPAAVTVNQGTAQPDPAGSLPVTFDVVFSEAVDAVTFTTADIIQSGTATGVTWNLATTDNILWTLTATAAVTEGTLVPSISASSVSDMAGNFNSASTSTDNSVDYNTSVLTVSIEQKGTADPTNALPVEFDVVFSSAIDPATFDAALDITQNGTATGITWSVSTIDNIAWILSADAVLGDGTIKPSLSAGVVATPAVVTNQISTSLDNTVTYDSTSPDVTVNQNAGQLEIVNALPVVFDVTFSEIIDPSSFTTADITQNGTATGVTWSITNSGDDMNFTLEATALTSDGTIIPSIGASLVNDIAGNLNNASTSTDNTVLYDNTQPSVTINQNGAQPDPSAAADLPITFNIVFSEEINPATFTVSDITQNGTAAGITWNLSSGDNINWILTATAVASDGTLEPSIAAGAVLDNAGKSNTASTSTDNSVNYNSGPPSVTLNQIITQADPTNVLPITFDVVFSEPIDPATFSAAADIIQNGTATGITWNLTTGNNKTWTLSVATVTGEGTVIPSINAGAVTDTTGNNNTASTSTDNIVNYDLTSPSVTVNQAATQTDPTLALPAAFDVVFSEPIDAASFTSADITQTGTAVITAWTISNPSSDKMNFIVTANTGSPAGTIIISLAAGTVSDLAGNLNLASTSTDNEVSYGTGASIVSVTSLPVSGTFHLDDLIQITITFSEPVTLSGGNLLIDLDSGASLTVSPPFGPANVLTIDYVVGENQETSDLTVTSISLETGASLLNAGGAMTDLTPPVGNNLADNSDIVIDAASRKDLSKAVAAPSLFNASERQTMTFMRLSSNTTIRVFSISGKKLFEKQVTTLTGNYEWDVKSDRGKKLASGVYFVVVTNDEGHKKVFKIAVVR